MTTTNAPRQNTVIPSVNSCHSERKFLLFERMFLLFQVHVPVIPSVCSCHSERSEESLLWKSAETFA